MGSDPSFSRFRVVNLIICYNLLNEPKEKEMQTIHLQVQDSMYEKLMSSGVDIQAKFDELIFDILDDGYPSISTEEAKERVSDAINRYVNKTGTYLSSEEYDLYKSNTIDSLRLKYANN